MSLNIKNADTEALARQVAARTGETLTGAITTALRERLQRLDAAPSEAEAEATVAAVMAIAADIAPRLKEPWRSQDHGDLLYDELGLPK